MLAEFGYDADGLAAGRALQVTAHQAYIARQQALAARQSADAADLAAEADARRMFTDYRRVARTLFKTPAQRTALGLKGKLPYDQEQFLQLARTAYQSALGTPAYANVLARSGYPASKLQDALAALDAVVAANNAQITAQAAAFHATRARRTALGALNEWLAQLNAVLRVATRTRADLAQKVGL